tara:strand:- start:227 stop:547 length:321 start_codon:yes stop_codon:yes gene_type:complete
MSETISICVGEDAEVLSDLASWLGSYVAERGGSVVWHEDGYTVEAPSPEVLADIAEQAGFANHCFDAWGEFDRAAFIREVVDFESPFSLDFDETQGVHKDSHYWGV